MYMYMLLSLVRLDENFGRMEFIHHLWWMMMQCDRCFASRLKVIEKSSNSDYGADFGHNHSIVDQKCEGRDSLGAQHISRPNPTTWDSTSTIGCFRKVCHCKETILSFFFPPCSRVIRPSKVKKNTPPEP